MKMEKSNSVSSLKKQLAAAVAMVCVAAVATSSATYAWFVSNNTVDATVSSIQAQSNAAFLTIDNVSTMENAGTHTDVTLTNSPISLYPSRPTENESGLAWTAASKASELTWQTAYAEKASESTVQKDSAGKGIYYALNDTTGYITTSHVYVSSSQGAFNSLKIDSMGVSEATGAQDAKSDIVNAVGALVSCGDNWELWEYDTTTSAWKQTTKSTNSLSGAADATFGDAVASNKVLNVNVTLFYDGDYETINTDNLTNLGQAKVTLAFSATPVQQGVTGDYQQNYDPNAPQG